MESKENAVWNSDLTWWEAGGASTSALRKRISQIVQGVFGETSMAGSKKQAIIDAAVKNVEAESARRLGAQALQNAAKYADQPNSTLYKNHMASAGAHANIADNLVREGKAILSSANANAAVLSHAETFAKNFGRALQLAEIGSALKSGDAHKVGRAAFSILAGMAVASSVAAIVPAGLLTTAAIIAGSIVGGREAANIWDSALAQHLGLKPGDALSLSKLLAGAKVTPELLALLQNNFKQAQAAQAAQLASPLILDLDGDGVETTGKLAKTHFDHDGNGFAERTGWVGADDGLLVFDLNSNGTIDDGSELFGNHTVLPDGTKAPHGFAALAAWDKNKDGVIDSRDEAFTKLRVWKDANGNGTTDGGELLTLDQAGVKSINVSHTDTSKVDEHGNNHLHTGYFTKTDGTNASVVDVWFGIDRADSVDKRVDKVSAEIATLPDVAGFGNVPGLHQAMVREEGVVLRTLIQKLMKATDTATRQSLVEAILIQWAGASSIAKDSRGAFVDGQKLSVLEAFLGTAFVGRNTARNPVSEAAPALKAAYGQLLCYMYAKLRAQTGLAPLFNKITMRIEGDGFVWDTSALVASLRQQFSADPEKTLEMLREFHFSIKEYDMNKSSLIEQSLKRHGDVCGDDLDVALATSGKNAVLGTSGTDILKGLDAEQNALYGFAGNDYLAGGKKDDVLDGGDGNDTLEGGDGNDLLAGGAGNDSLGGGAGKDTYLFARGWGHDTIFAGHGERTDIIQFSEDIRPDDIEVIRAGLNLILRLKNGVETITVLLHFQQGSAQYRGQVNEVRFNDGTVWDYASLGAARAEASDGDDVLHGTPGNDILRAGKGDDVLQGDDGDDQLYGGEGNDILHGGKGVDRMFGGEGNDVLNGDDGDDHLDGGDGNDQLIGGSGNDMLLGGSGDDKLEGGNGLDTLDGGDGDDVLDGGNWHDVLLGGNGNDTLNGGHGSDYLNGGAGNDIIMGDEGNDILEGGEGNDILKGGQGNDTYVFREKWGRDVIDNSGSDPVDRNTIVFKEGIQTSDITMTRIGADLVLWFKGRRDMITIIRHFDEAARGHQAAVIGYPIERIQFADGTVWTEKEIRAAVQKGGDGDDLLIGTEKNDTLDGGAGNDVLRGENGNDELFGGEGDDKLYGNDGNDVLHGGAGNDLLRGDRGDDILHGDDGNDELHGDYGNDVLYGGAGNDILHGGEGDDKLFGGEGNDTIYGGLGADLLESGAGHNKLYGGAGNDTLLGGSGNNELYGGQGNDTLTGGAGNDILDGGSGEDMLTGGKGNDTYVFARGSGEDLIVDHDETAGNQDVVQFGKDIKSDQVWFTRDGDNLQMTILGTDDMLSVSDWFLGSAHQIEEIRTGDGKTLSNGNVNVLVQAMASFDIPGPADTTVPPSYLAKLQPVLAASWQSN